MLNAARRRERRSGIRGLGRRADLFDVTVKSCLIDVREVWSE
jgi:hypothetical protein